MPVHQLVPMLYTKQLKESIDFYVEILGFSCTAYDESLGWASLNLDQVEIMLSLPNDHIPFEKAQFTGSFYFYTDEVDMLWESWNKKVQVAYPLESFSYGMWG